MTDIWLDDEREQQEYECRIEKALSALKARNIVRKAYRALRGQK